MVDDELPQLIVVSKPFADHLTSRRTKPYKRDELGDLHHDWLRAEIEIGWQAAARGDFAEGCTPEKVLARAEALEEAVAADAL